MGEIRSTIDLMMERTKGLSLSEQEKKALKREELQKRAKGIYLKLTQNPSLLPTLLEGIRDSDEPDNNTLISFLWNTFVENIPAGRDMDKYLDLMRELPVSAEQLALLNALQEELKLEARKGLKERKAALAAERRRLEAVGISGTAVVPKLKSDRDYNQPILARYKDLLILDVN